MHHVVDDEVLFRKMMDRLYAHARQPSPHPLPVKLKKAVGELGKTRREQVSILVAEQPGEVPPLLSPELLIAIKELVADLGDMDAPSDEDAAKLACLIYMSSELIEELTREFVPKPK